ncbi:MAG: hypothetical protein ACON4Z_09210 [Planctomycetota bacterium]
MKTLLITSFLGATATTAMVVPGESMRAMGLQLAQPAGAALDASPAANGQTWSWTGPADGTPILIDVDGDGVMDTGASGQCVVITDAQVHRDATVDCDWSVDIVDSSGPRWRLQNSYPAGHVSALDSQFFRTPIVLPAGSDLVIQADGVPSDAAWTPTVTLIGRVVDLD